MQALPPFQDTPAALLHGLKLFLSAELVNVGAHRQRAREFLERHLAPGPDTEDLVMVIDEALTNVIRHSCDAQGDHALQLQIHLETSLTGETTQLTVLIVDRGDAGRRYSPSMELASNLARLAAGEQVGYGLVLMYRVMDAVEYWVTPSGENRLVLHKAYVQGRSPEPTYLSRLIQDLQATGSLSPA